MNLASSIYAEVYIICIIILGFVFFWFQRTRDNSSSGNWYRASLISFILTFIFDLFWCFADGGLFPKTPPFILCYIFKTLYYIGLNVAFLTWIAYSEAEQGSSAFREADTRRILLLPFVLLFIALATDYWTHVMFWFDINGNYKRGGVYQLQMCMVLLYIGVTGARMLSKAHYETNAMRKNQMRLIGAFPITIGLSWILSILLGEKVPIICVGVALSILLIHTGASSQQISIDKLTHINNRQNLMEHIDQKIHQHDGRLFLLMMDVDRFKLINDNFGHQEGDQALIRVANALKGACEAVKRRPYLARYGGDEFIIVAEVNDESEIDALCEQINDKLHYYNSWSQFDYHLQMSIGRSEWKEGMKQKDLIDSADEQLYKVKEIHHAEMDARNESAPKVNKAE